MREIQERENRVVTMDEIPKVAFEIWGQNLFAEKLWYEEKISRLQRDLESYQREAFRLRSTAY